MVSRENAEIGNDGTWQCRLTEDTCGCVSIKDDTPRCDACHIPIVQKWWEGMQEVSNDGERVFETDTVTRQKDTAAD